MNVYIKFAKDGRWDLIPREIMEQLLKRFNSYKEIQIATSSLIFAKINANNVLESFNKHVHKLRATR